jgi:hypothetical protein
MSVRQASSRLKMLSNGGTLRSIKHLWQSKKRESLTARHFAIASNMTFCGRDYILNPLFKQFCTIE